jgi:hypothetical protein
MLRHLCAALLLEGMLKVAIEKTGQFAGRQSDEGGSVTICPA